MAACDDKIWIVRPWWVLATAMTRKQINIGSVAAPAWVHVLAWSVGKISVEDIVIFPSGDDGEVSKVIPVAKPLGSLNAVRQIRVEATGTVNIDCAGRIRLPPDTAWYKKC